MYDWMFTPDDADIAASNGYDLGVRGGETFKTESRAIWHGKRWMKECGRTGTITAIPAIDPEPYHIIEKIGALKEVISNDLLRNSSGAV